MYPIDLEDEPGAPDDEYAGIDADDLAVALGMDTGDEDDDEDES